MKKIYFRLFATTMMALMCVGFTSCGGDDDDENGIVNQTEEQDPEGTGIANIKLYIYKYDYSSFSFDTYCWIVMDQSNNFRCSTSGEVAPIVSVGKVKGISSIKKIPSTGWNEKAGVVPDYGYVVNFNGVYARIYVIDYIRDSDGNIIGATFKYQYPWNPNGK